MMYTVTYVKNQPMVHEETLKRETTSAFWFGTAVGIIVSFATTMVILYV